METTNLCQIPKADDKSTGSVCDPFATPHFANGLHLTPFDVVLDSELILDKMRMLLYGINEVTSRSGNER
jgi:hypothetical protein